MAKNRKKTNSPRGPDRPGNRQSASGDAGRNADRSRDVKSPKDKNRKQEKKKFNARYERELARLHIELIKLQEWIKHEGLKVVVIFEGRDAAGKGGVIKRITQGLNPRVCRVVALGTPTEREKTQW